MLKRKAFKFTNVEKDLHNPRPGVMINTNAAPLKKHDKKKKTCPTID
jgi:hypothetical protein